MFLLEYPLAFEPSLAELAVESCSVKLVEWLRAKPSQAKPRGARVGMAEVPRCWGTVVSDTCRISVG